MKLHNATTGEVIASRVRVMNRWHERFIGFLQYRPIDPRDALWFPRCAAVHTTGMRVPIDIVFLDKHARVLRLHSRVRPNKFLVACYGATTAVELCAGALELCDVLVSDTLSLQ